MHPCGVKPHKQTHPGGVFTKTKRTLPDEMKTNRTLVVTLPNQPTLVGVVASYGVGRRVVMAYGGVDGDDEMMMVAVVLVVVVEVAARGGEWYSGSYRSDDEEKIGTWPEKLTGKLFRRRPTVAGGGAVMAAENGGEKKMHTPPSKTSPLVDDDLDEDEAIKVTEKKNIENDIEDETL
ncbi:hypothetical protein Tco_0700812 [Tanacetum coccineum]